MEGAEMEGVLKWLWDIVARIPWMAPWIARGNRAKRAVTLFLKRHPTLAFLALVALLGLIGVKTVSALQQPETCRRIEVEHSELYKPNGDTLVFSRERPCESEQVVAFEFFNHSDVVKVQGKPPIKLVSAGIFLKQTALG